MSTALPILQTDDAAAPPAAPRQVVRAGRLVDAHGRTVRDLRLSVTDRCNYRCVYCMDPDYRYMRKRELLSLGEYVTVARVCASLGIEKIRITGGEPMLYPQLDD
ncbi:MAG: radical SAM protein, partial [Planctomycetota bacterium]